MTDRIFSESFKNTEEDKQYYASLRPSRIEEFVGQENIIDRLKVFVKAAKERKEALEHVLFSGPPGLGKTTLAYILCEEMGSKIHVTSGPAIERPGDLAGLLTNLEDGDFLFIDEIHRLNRVVEEYLYSAMEDYLIDIVLDKGPSARSVRLNLNRFTLVGSTTRTGLLTSPLRTRFGMTNRLDYYNEDQLFSIILRSAKLLNIEIYADGAREIAGRSRGTPRIANCLLRRVRDYAQVKADNIITSKIADLALQMMEVDEKGLDEMDKRILETIIHKFNGGPVGLGSLAVAVGEESNTIEEVYEPYLIQQGYLKRTLNGRKATKLAYQHLSCEMPRQQSQEEFF